MCPHQLVLREQWLPALPTTLPPGLKHEPGGSSVQVGMGSVSLHPGLLGQGSVSCRAQAPGLVCSRTALAGGAEGHRPSAHPQPPFLWPSAPRSLLWDGELPVALGGRCISMELHRSGFEPALGSVRVSVAPPQGWPWQSSAVSCLLPRACSRRCLPAHVPPCSHPLLSPKPPRTQDLRGQCGQSCGSGLPALLPRPCLCHHGRPPPCLLYFIDSCDGQ